MKDIMLHEELGFADEYSLNAIATERELTIYINDKVAIVLGENQVVNWDLLKELVDAKRYSESIL